MNKEQIRLKARKILIGLTKNRRNKKLICKDFTIISNNCWGGMVYESFNLPKQSPTVGLFFMADEYLKFLRVFPNILNEQLIFIDPSTSQYSEYLKTDKRFGHYPIGHLGDVEICFLHYRSEEEARQKWNRRCERINWNHIIFKMNDQNLCTQSHLTEFSKMNHQKNRIIFSSKDYNLPHLIHITSARKQECVQASQEPVVLNRYINIIDYINECFKE